jgi:hypothetical protein
LTAALIAQVFEKSRLIINLFNNIPYFVIAVFSIYMIGRKLFNKSTGLLSVIIFSLYPAVYGSSRLYILEFAVMGMAALCILCLLNTEEFTNQRHSLLFGLALGWGMMIKYSLFAFIIGPLIYVIYKALTSSAKGFSNKTMKFSTQVLNIYLFVLVAFSIMGIKYFNLNNTITYLLRLFQRNISGPWYNLNNLRVYTLGLFEQQLSLFFFLILLFALFAFFYKVERKIKIIFLSWIMIPWIILLIMPNLKMTHYIIPYLPAIALISATGLTYLLRQKRTLKVISIGLMITIGIIQYYDFSFGFGPGLDNYKIKVKNTDIHYYMLSKNICNRPDYDSSFNKIISSISKWGKEYGSNVLILPPDYSLYSKSSIWNCILWFKELPFEVIILEDKYSFITDALAALEKADFILYSGINDIKDPYYLDELLRESRKKHAAYFDYKNVKKIELFLERDLKRFKLIFQEMLRKFALVEKIICEEGICLKLYKKL